MMKFIKRPIIFPDEKKEIVEFIYDKLNINRFRYTIITTETHVDHLKKNEHHLLLNYPSTNFLLIFMFVNSKKLCLLVDRKSLNYQPKNQSEVIKSSVICSLDLNFPVKGELYKGTILDVKMVNNTFYVYNVFLWKGFDRTNEPSFESFRLVNSEHIGRNDQDIGFINKIDVYKYEDLKEIKKMIHENPKISGISFVPKIPGNLYIFLHNPKIKNTTTTTTAVVATTSAPIEAADKSLHMFKMCQFSGDIPDIYILKSESYKKGLLAGIPDIKTSHMCKKWFFETKSKFIDVKCKYKESIDKYIPVSLA